MTHQYVRSVDVGRREQRVKVVRLLVGGGPLRRLLTELDARAVIAADTSSPCDLRLDRLPVTVVSAQTGLEDDRRRAVPGAEEIQVVPTSLISEPWQARDCSCPGRRVTATRDGQQAERHQRKRASCHGRSVLRPPTSPLYNVLQQRSRRRPSL